MEEPELDAQLALISRVDDEWWAQIPKERGRLLGPFPNPEAACDAAHDANPGDTTVYEYTDAAWHWLKNHDEGTSVLKMRPEQ